MKKVFTTIFVLFFVLTGPMLFAEQKSWKDRFDDICSRVQIAESLSKAELRDLIKRSDELIKELEKLNLPVKKVYIFRLKKCRSFFEYVIQLREREDK